MEDSSETLVRVRKEYMVSPNNGGNPTYRTAHFLPPCVFSSIDEHSHHNNLPSSSSSCSIDPHNVRFKLSFPGWRFKSLDGWKSWVNLMISTHLSSWKNAGIHEAILGSTYKIRRDNYDLVLGIAEKWCSKTQSFIFPWGEATITLEDMMILGGFSVLGDSVLKSVEQEEFQDIEEKLRKARLELNNTASRKPSLSVWMKRFMNSGSEIEHEAFLSYWLSAFVFPYNETVHHQVFPLAIKLSRGSKIALAPAVLAGIYRDLSILKAKFFALSSNESENEVSVLNLTIKSPFHLVQTWVWERFPGLRPQPYLLKNGEPRLARWGNLQSWKKIDNVRMVLDSSGGVFQWRPYCNHAVGNWEIPKFYTENELLLPDGPGFDEDFMSFARCLRVSELVGLDTIEQYLPNRVSMQFGMDQGVPCEVKRFDETPSIAWTHYNMNISNFDLYVPPRPFEADVSERYLRWWKQSARHFFKPKRSTGTVSEYRNFLKRKMDGEACYMGLEGKEGHENSKRKKVRYFVKLKRTPGISVLAYGDYLKRKMDGEKACGMGFSSKRLSKGSLVKSQERPKQKVEEQAYLFSMAQEEGSNGNDKKGLCGNVSSSMPKDLKSEAAMKESKMRRFLGKEKVGEKEKQTLIAYLEDTISKLEKEVADRKAARFFTNN